MAADLEDGGGRRLEGGGHRLALLLHGAAKVFGQRPDRLSSTTQGMPASNRSAASPRPLSGPAQDNRATPSHPRTRAGSLDLAVNRSWRARQ